MKPLITDIRIQGLPISKEDRNLILNQAIDSLEWYIIYGANRLSDKDFVTVRIIDGSLDESKLPAYCEVI